MAALPRSNEDTGEADPHVWRISVQYVTDEDGNRTHVIIPNDQFEMLLDDLEDLWCTRAYDLAKAEGGEARPLEEILAEWGDEPA
jgi:hypothetical protein